MATGRRTLVAELAGLSAVLALAGCRTDPNAGAPADVLESEEVQNAMNALVDAVDVLQKTIGELGAVNPRDVAQHLRTAAADVSSALAGLRHALGYPDSN
jgi:hypothetical protein